MLSETKMTPGQKTTQKVICAHNMAALKEMADNSVDSVVTDGPYGLGEEPDVLEVLKDWIDHGYHEVRRKKGFMNLEWDSFVPQPNFWKEVYRVLKPGGHVLSFSGTRTYDLMVMSMRFGGFEIRDQILWLHPQGFPKSMNISKSIDKQNGAEREVLGVRNNGMKPKANGSHNFNGRDVNNGVMMSKEIKITVPSTDAAKQWDGWGTAIKPATEPIVLARKPISEKTIADNILKWGTGALNIDASRIGFSGEQDFKSATFGRGTDIMGGNFVGGTHGTGETNIEANPSGRFPANMILSHHPDCELIPGNAEGSADQYNCHPHCAVKILNDQTGILKSGAVKKDYAAVNNTNSLGVFNNIKTSRYQANEGFASRFFYCAKASRSEKNFGLEQTGTGGRVNMNKGEAWKCKDCDRKYQYGASACPKCGSVSRELYDVGSRPMANMHETVKPVKLMQYLVRLVTPPGGICLDPYNGSGTTGIACKLEGFNYIGIEENPKHCEVSEARIAAWQPEPADYDNQLSFDFLWT